MSDKIVFEGLNICREKMEDFTPPDLYWLSSEDCELDQSMDYCFECAEKQAKILTAELKAEVYVDGGYALDGNDTIALCEECGILLNYTLSASGVKSELDHYLKKNTKIDLNNEEECYSFIAILDCYNDYLSLNNRLLKLAKLILESK